MTSLMKHSRALRSLLLIGTLALTSCYTTTGTLSREPVAYLQLSGVGEGYTAIIDDSPPVALVSENGLAQLQIAPGRHRVRILRGGVERVDRTLLVSDLQTLEISVP